MSFQGSSTMHQLVVTPLLLQKSSVSTMQFKRESHSFDNLNTSGSDIYAGVHKAQSFHRRSNPNILDILPPPPIYAPPSLPRNKIYYAQTNGSGNRYYPHMNRTTTGTQSPSFCNKRHIKIYEDCDNDRTLSFNYQKECPNHLTNCNENKPEMLSKQLSM